MCTLAWYPLKLVQQKKTGAARESTALEFRGMVSVMMGSTPEALTLVE